MKKISRFFYSISFIIALTAFSGIQSPAIAAVSTAGYNVPANSTQLAYWWGWGPRYHNERVYRYGPIYRQRGVYWTNWYRIAPRCQKRCLVNGYGETIRCVRRCR